MPGKPTSEENNQLPQDTEETANEYPGQVIRELTQTDQLNKKLLASFLQRMNNSPGEFTSNVENEELNGDLCSPPENENEF